MSRLLLLCLSVCLLATGPANAVAQDAGPRDASWSVDLAVRRDVRFRESIGFRSDREYVRSLYAAEATRTEDAYGARLTTDERAELDARTALEADADRVSAWFDESAARREAFAGVMIDHVAGGKLVVFMTDRGSEIDEGWRSTVAQRDRLELRPASLSLGELQSIQQRLREAIIAENPIMEAWTETSLDIEQNAVVVSFEADELDGRSAPVGFYEHFGSVGLVVDEAQPSIATVNLANDPNAPPVYGGHSWKIASHSGPYCSLGFNVGRSGTSGDWMITAGHCIDQIALGTNM